MNFLKLQKKTFFKMRIVYKSGYTHDFWCTKFKIDRGMGGSVSYSWHGELPSNRPLQFGADDVAAVWQIGCKTRYTFAVDQE